MRELCFNLLRDWCDGLISLQIRKLGDPTIDGAFHCRACKVFHGRCPDAVYSLVYMYRETRDEKYLEAVFDTGAYAMFDNFGKEYYFTAKDAVFSGGPFETDLDRVRMIIRMIKKGHTGRLMLATDVCLKSLLHSFGGWSFDHIFTNIVPMMENEGISKENIETIINKNPTEFICSR